MKLRLTAASIIGAAALIGVSSSAFAADVSSGTSKSSITFQAGTGPVPPVDPIDPTKPIDPTDPTNPTDPPIGETGPLSLNYVSSVDFGSHQVDGGTKVYSSKSLKPFIQVSDYRGTNAGWTVTAKASKFTNGTSDSLPGAVITFKNGETVSPDTAVAPKAESVVTLNADGTTTAKVVSAKDGQGAFRWVTRWLGATPSDPSSLNDNVTLTVPGGSASTGAHQATITWTLTDAPGN